MRNRTGVVFYANPALIKDVSLGFKPCKQNGDDLDPIKEVEIVETPKVTKFKKPSKKSK
jgi:hypothetical protein